MIKIYIIKADPPACIQLHKNVVIASHHNLLAMVFKTARLCHLSIVGQIAAMRHGIRGKTPGANPAKTTATSPRSTQV